MSSASKPTQPLRERIIAALRAVPYGKRTAGVAQLASACVLETRSELKRMASEGLVEDTGDDVCGLWIIAGRSPKH